MAALSERKIAIVRTLVETAPDRVVGNLRQALAETAEDSALGGVRRLVETEVSDRTLRNTVLQPVAPMFVGGGDHARTLTFPSRALALLWRGLKAADGPAVAQASADSDDAVPAQTAQACQDRLVAIAGARLRSRTGTDFRAAAEICDLGRPNGADQLASCLEIAAVVRRAVRRLPEWLAHPGNETAASARLAYKDAVEISEDAGPRFFEMLAAQMPQSWMVLRIISAVMDNPTERYLADSELACFAEAVMDDIDAALVRIAGFNPEEGVAAARAAADMAELVVRQMLEVETSVDLDREHGWGQRVHKQRLRFVEVVEGRLREAEKAVTEALPMPVTRLRRVTRSIPRLSEMPDARLVGRATALLSFAEALRTTANYGGFSATRAKVIEKLTEFLATYVQEVLDLIRSGEVEVLENAAAYLEAAAGFSHLVAGDKAGALVRRRAHTALYPEASHETTGQ